jgi:hypothetical protein
LAGAPQLSTPYAASDESLAHVRAALEKAPPALTLPERQADFSVTINERDRFDRLMPPILDFNLGPGLPQQELFTSPWGSQPIVSVDVMSLVVAAAVGVNQLRKAHPRRWRMCSRPSPSIAPRSRVAAPAFRSAPAPRPSAESDPSTFAVTA